MDADVIVVGAGLAGLMCARTLGAAGRHVVVLEAADRIGGRVTTETVDGFQCDLGFQVLNPAYPAVHRWLDVDRLDLRTFDAGILVRASDGLRVLADPIRAPHLAWATLRSRLVTAGEAARLASWVAPFLINPQRAARAGDRSLGDSLDAAGVTGPLRRVLDRFLAGVLVDSHGETSANYARLLVRSFIFGTPGVPAAGMQALPAQLAHDVPDIRLSTAVREISAVTASAGRRVVTAAGSLQARHVVVATDSASARALIDLPPVATEGLVTWWFATPSPPDTRPLLAVDGRHGQRGGPPGPVWNTAVMTAIAPSYAPSGQHLVQATSLLDRPDGDSLADPVLRHVGDIYGCSTAGWQVVARHRIPDAVPSCPAPVTLRRPVRVGDRLWVCGDHRDTGSIQGALVSGRRVAAAVSRDLEAE